MRGATSDIDIRVEGRAGRITLTRPGAMNALTHAMATEIERALIAWRDDDDVGLVLIDGAGPRAFCAGGDIQDLYATGRAGDFAYGRRFWADEYRLNAMIAGYPKPYVALMHGFVMGGGVGISAHGSHRVVCEDAAIAMPECGIGLVPDVGGSWLLARAPGRLGEYLGLTGARMGPADAIHAGFADAFVPRDRWGRMVERLVARGTAEAVGAFETPPPPSAVAALEPALSAPFALPDVDAIRAALSGARLADPSSAGAPSADMPRADAPLADAPWAAAARAALDRASPLSLACALAIIRAARTLPRLEDALAREYRFTARCMEHGDFLEGVRAAVIDKDRRPVWRVEGTAEQVAAMLAPLLPHDLRLDDLRHD